MPVWDRKIGLRAVGLGRAFAGGGRGRRIPDFLGPFPPRLEDAFRGRNRSEYPSCRWPLNPKLLAEKGLIPFRENYLRAATLLSYIPFTVHLWDDLTDAHASCQAPCCASGFGVRSCRLQPRPAGADAIGVGGHQGG